MKIFCVLFATVFLNIQTKSTLGKQSYKSGVNDYIVRILNLTTIDSTGQSYIKDVKWTSRNMVQYVSAEITARRTYVIRRIQLCFDKCLDLEWSCEYFLNFNVTDVCSYLNMKNQIWSSALASIDRRSFQESCPRLEQGTYSMKNATLDINPIVSMFKDAIQYYWKVQLFFFDRKNEIQHQFYLHLRFVPVFKRNSSVT